MSKKKTAPRYPNSIRLCREQSGLKVFQLAQKVGMTPGNLSRIERGEVNATSDVLQRISKVLKINPGALLDPASHAHAVSPSAPSDVDGKVLGQSITLVTEICEKMKLAATPEEISQWSVYVYNEATGSNKSVAELHEVAAGVIKFSRQKRA